MWVYNWNNICFASDHVRRAQATTLHITHYINILSKHFSQAFPLAGNSRFLLDRTFLHVMLLILSQSQSPRPILQPNIDTHLDPLKVGQCLLSNVLVDLPGGKCMTLREDFFHLESTTISIDLTKSLMRYQ